VPRPTGRNVKDRLRITLFATLLMAPVRALGSPSPNEDATKADCSFSNANLPGFCNVTVPVPRNSTPQQACEAVRSCINGSQCADSQKYCFNPGVPKIWKLEQARASLPRVNCAYSNPSYSGWCRRTAPVPKDLTPRQACEAVLACLNGSPCEGFTLHCDPDIWSGWRLEEVHPEPRPTPRR
jgi:hypothetical protein